MKILDIPKPSKWFSLSNLLSKPKSPAPTLLPRPSPPPKTATNEADYREVFRFFDKNGDGKLSIEELIAYFLSIGEFVSQNKAQRVISEFDKDGDNLLDFEEFVKLMEREKDEEGGENYLRRAFEMFEDEKGSGCITPKGLQQVLNLLGGDKSYEECEAMIRVFDVDGNGVVDFHEFHKMME